MSPLLPSPTSSDPRPPRLPCAGVHLSPPPPPPAPPRFRCTGVKLSLPPPPPPPLSPLPLLPSWLMMHPSVNVERLSLVAPADVAAPATRSDPAKSTRFIRLVTGDVVWNRVTLSNGLTHVPTSAEAYCVAHSIPVYSYTFVHCHRILKAGPSPTTLPTCILDSRFLTLIASDSCAGLP